MICNYIIDDINIAEVTAKAKKEFQFHVQEMFYKCYSFLFATMEAWMYDLPSQIFSNKMVTCIFLFAMMGNMDVWT